MSQKLFNLISVITTAICAVAAGIITYIGKGPVTAINESIMIAEGAIIAICGNFIKEE